MNALQNHAFGHLLAAWARREEARNARNLRQLSDARFKLESARSDMRSSLSALR